jgi:hypothetical protein|mmetsp:Transcript_74602/g.121217  ORF Transcript_74602/g.121217 Transcript_74602/m.121217 type:complete len:235 (+) Transcript_74602:379-1083(+)
MFEKLCCEVNKINNTYKSLGCMLRIKFNVVNYDYHKEACNFTKYIYILRNIVKIPFVFWEIISTFIGARIYEKVNSLFRILKKTKIFWIRKKFSIKKLVRLRYTEISKISQLVTGNFSKFLNCCGSIFYTKFFNKFTNILNIILDLGKLFKKKLNRNLLSGFLSIFFDNLFHYPNIKLFIKLNSNSLIISNICFTMKMCSAKRNPWWRNCKLRECELEYVNKKIVFSLCSSIDR